MDDHAQDPPDQASEAVAPLTPAVFHVLLALASGESHGYGVMKRVQEDSGIEMGPGTVYGTLRRLRDAGWVEPGENDGGDARRGRSFRLTPSGRTALHLEARRIARIAGMEEVRRLLPEGGP